MGYADENAVERPILWSGGKSSVDRLGVVLLSDVVGLGTVRRVTWWSISGSDTHGSS